MNSIGFINRFIGLFIETIKQIGAGKVWLVLFGYFFINWIILFAHHNFYLPIFYGIISVWTSLFGETYATGFIHYPGHLQFLGYFFGWGKFFFALFFEGIILAYVARLFYLRYSPQKKFTTSLKKIWLHLVMAWILMNGILLLISTQLPPLVNGLIVNSPRRELIFNYGIIPFLYFLVFSLFFFVIPIIAIYEESFLKAVKRSLTIFIQNPLTCFFISFLVLLGPIVISFVTNNPTIIIEKFDPELVYWVLIFSLVIDIFANFFWIGTVVRFLYDEE